MKITKKMLNEIETPEARVDMDRWFLKYIEKENARNEEIKIMMANQSYLEWLTQFTKDKEGFSDEDWLYFPERIKDSDKANVEKLGLFYDGIDNYAQQNYIYPLPCEFGNFYKIRLNEIDFEIGMLVGQGTVFYCKKVKVENEQEFIDFNDIMTNKKQEQVAKINTILESLSNMVFTAYKNGVPIEAISSTLEDIIDEITSSKEDNPKTLIKK